MSKLPSKYNFANFLSISRIFSTVPLLYCLNNFELPNFNYYTAFIIFYIFISDILDGYFARRANEVTDFGKIIDPVADKICLNVVLIYLIDVYQIEFLFFYILTSIRDIVLLIYTVYLALVHNHVAQANLYGKIFIFSTTLMMITYIYRIDGFIQVFLYCLSVVLLIVSMLSYIKSHKNNIKRYEHI